MPTYVVTVPQGRISPQQKERIAADVTRNSLHRRK